MSDPDNELFLRWFAALEKRHLRELRFAEVRRALQSLTTWYVERRDGVSRGAPLDAAGKRAAYSMFYGPLHFLTVREIVRRLGAAADPMPTRILDLGCGSGAAGAAWSLETGGRAHLSGVDVNRWAVDETNTCWSSLGLSGRARPGRIEGSRLPGPGEAVLLAYAANELTGDARDELLGRLLGGTRRGGHVLVVEPISRRAAPWWDAWAERFTAAGGRADHWRFTADLPERLRLLDRAAGLDHRELTARSLYAARKGSSLGLGHRQPMSQAKT